MPRSFAAAVRLKPVLPSASRMVLRSTSSRYCGSDSPAAPSTGSRPSRPGRRWPEPRHGLRRPVAGGAFGRLALLAPRGELQVLGGDQLATRERERALEDVFELAHVAGGVVARARL